MTRTLAQVHLCAPPRNPRLGTTGAGPAGYRLRALVLSPAALIPRYQGWIFDMKGPVPDTRDPQPIWRDVTMASRLGLLVCLAMNLLSCRSSRPLTPVIERQERWLACRLGEHQVLVVKGAAKGHNPGDLIPESPAAEWLFYVVFSKDVGIAALSLENGGGKQSLPVPAPIFKMPNSPLATHFFAGRDIAGRLVFSDRGGLELFSVGLTTYATQLQALPFFWHHNPGLGGQGAEIDWQALPSSIYSGQL